MDSSQHVNEVPGAGVWGVGGFMNELLQEASLRLSPFHNRCFKN